jgi:hypothetical protein
MAWDLMHSFFRKKGLWCLMIMFLNYMLILLFSLGYSIVFSSSSFTGFGPSVIDIRLKVLSLNPAFFLGGKVLYWLPAWLSLHCMLPSFHCYVARQPTSVRLRVANPKVPNGDGVRLTPMEKDIQI